MSKQILVNFSHYETRVATLENGEIRSLHIEREEDKNVVGNIYLGVVKRVLPGMQAAFLELGLERTAFLYVDDIIDQPFGGDVELLSEDSESESTEDSSLELGADDDGEPLKESYDEELEAEGGRRGWEREVSELPAPSKEGAETASLQEKPEEASEEFFEKSPEERAEELIKTTEEEDTEEELFESDDIDDEEGESEGASDEEDDFEDEEFEEEEESEEFAEEESGQGSEATQQEVAAKSTEELQPERMVPELEVSSPEGRAETKEESRTTAEPRTRDSADEEQELDGDNVGNRVQGSQERQGNRGHRGRNWGRRPSHGRDRGRGERGQRDSYSARGPRGRDRGGYRDQNSEDEYRAPSDRERLDRERYERESGGYRDSRQDYDRGQDYGRGYRDREGGQNRDRDRGRGRDYNREDNRDRNRNLRDRSDRDRDRDRDRERDSRDRDPRDRDPRDREPRDRDSRGREPRDRDSRDRDPRDRNRQARGHGRGGRSRNDRDRGPERNEGGRRSPRRPHHHGGRSRNGRRFQKRRTRGSANIQDLLKEGQEILVQVAKAPIGTKGARLTTHISLPGRNLVLMPTVKHLGISRRIESDRERRRLRDIFTKRLRPKDAGFIIRTVAEGKSFRDLKADAEYLLKTWARIKRDSKNKRAPALIHEDLSLSMRAVRDFFTEEVDSFVIDNAEEHENVLQFIEQFMPQLKGAVKLFKGPSQLFEHYGIEAEISRALNKKVWLKSGGYLLFDQSEALTAIDVNTGRYVGSKSLEETILKTNLEAVKEIAYQLRIRNVGGIIILDLIDMESMENREKVYQALQEALSEDKSRTNILKISELGLVEMTRKRTHEDLIRYLTEACSVCEGRGYHKSRRTVCFEIFREIEKEALSNTKNIVVFAAPAVVSRMMKEEKKHVSMLEERFGKKITVKPDPEFHVEQYEVFGKH